MQRVRIGLTGLALVFLLVLLTTALFGLVTREGAIRGDGGRPAAPPSVENAADQPKDPLAELGVTPGHSPAETRPANESAPAH